MLTLTLPALSGQPKWVSWKETPNVGTSYYDANSAYYRDGSVYVWFLIKYQRPVLVPVLNITVDKGNVRVGFPCDKHEYFVTYQDSLFYLGDELVRSNSTKTTSPFAPGSDDDQARDYFCPKYKP